MLVVAAARRPVRFLAKAPLLSDRGLGWLIRGAGAIPVYRRSDDPRQMRRNEDSFREVYAALAAGSAVGIFPEGTSHSEPSMVPLRTGAARIALGAAALTGRAFPVVPVGLVHRRKDVFRSEAIAITGAPVAWSDLAARGVDDGEAVRELTDRIDESLRQVTLNLEHWEDRPLIEGVVRVWEAERGERPTAADRVARLDVAARILADVRYRGDEDALQLARDVSAHDRRLRRLGLRPSDLGADVGLSRGVWWATRKLHLFMPIAAVLALIGGALFWIPYRLTGLVTDRLPLPKDVRSTGKLLGGVLFYALWMALLISLAFLRYGIKGAVVFAVAAPSLGMIGLFVRERWRYAWSDVRRFFLLRSRRELAEALRERQRELGRRLNALYSAYLARERG